MPPSLLGVFLTKKTCWFQNTCILCSNVHSHSHGEGAWFSETLTELCRPGPTKEFVRYLGQEGNDENMKPPELTKMFMVPPWLIESVANPCPIKQHFADTAATPPLLRARINF